MRHSSSVFRFTWLYIAACVCPAAALASDEGPVFFIDTPTLIRKTAEAIYEKRDEIADGELVTTYDPVSISCKAGRQKTLRAQGNTYCPAPKKIDTPCIARVKLLVRSSIKSDITVLGNGQCEIHFSYKSINAEQFENGQILVSGGSGGGNGSRVGECATLKPYLEISEAIQMHQNALEREISFQQP